MIKLMRLEQWVKNCFCFVPLLFSGELLHGASVMASLLAFLAFCFASSAVYCFNDIIDAEADRRHPVKCRRPVASGSVTRRQAIVLALLCVAVSFAFTALLPGPAVRGAVWVIILYLGLNVAYCLRLKRVAIIDLTCIAIGFILRILLGAVAIGVVPSHWILIVTFLLAYFLGLSKRRDDVVLMQDANVVTRDSIRMYSLAFIDCALAVLAASILMSYLMYTLSDDVITRLGTPNLYVTGLFVFLGMLRYLQQTIVAHTSVSPTRLLFSDRFLQGCIAGWIIVLVCLIY